MLLASTGNLSAQLLLNIWVKRQLVECAADTRARRVRARKKKCANVSVNSLQAISPRMKEISLHLSYNLLLSKSVLVCWSHVGPDYRYEDYSSDVETHLIETLTQYTHDIFRPVYIDLLFPVQSSPLFSIYWGAFVVERVNYCLHFY